MFELNKQEKTDVSGGGECYDVMRIGNAFSTEEVVKREIVGICDSDPAACKDAVCGWGIYTGWKYNGTYFHIDTNNPLQSKEKTVDLKGDCKISSSLNFDL